MLWVQSLIWLWAWDQTSPRQCFHSHLHSFSYDFGKLSPLRNPSGITWRSLTFFPSILQICDWVCDSTSPLTDSDHEECIRRKSMSGKCSSFMEPRTAPGWNKSWSLRGLKWLLFHGIARHDHDEADQDANFSHEELWKQLWWASWSTHEQRESNWIEFSQNGLGSIKFSVRYRFKKSTSF